MLTVYADQKKIKRAWATNDTTFGKLLDAKKVFLGRILSFLGIYC